MKRAIRTTARADAEVRRVDEWWRRHRSAAPNLFLDEFAAALEIARTTPELGRPYVSPNHPGVRRMLMRASRYHVYFVFDDDNVAVLAIWSAVRGRGPRI